MFVGNFSYSLDFLPYNAVIEKHKISFFHFFEIIACLIVAYPVPVGFFIYYELIPVVLGWFLFDKPKTHKFDQKTNSLEIVLRG